MIRSFTSVCMSPRQHGQGGQARSWCLDSRVVWAPEQRSNSILQYRSVSSDDVCACRCSGHNCVVDMVGARPIGWSQRRGSWLVPLSPLRVYAPHPRRPCRLGRGSSASHARSTSFAACCVAAAAAIAGGEEPQAGVGFVPATSAYRLDREVLACGDVGPDEVDRTLVASQEHVCVACHRWASAMSVSATAARVAIPHQFAMPLILRLVMAIAS